MLFPKVFSNIQTNLAINLAINRREIIYWRVYR